MWTCTSCTPIKAVFHGPGPKALIVLHGVMCDLPVEERRTRVLPFLHSSKRAQGAKESSLREAGSDGEPTPSGNPSLPELPDIPSAKEGPEDVWVSIDLTQFEIC